MARHAPQLPGTLEERCLTHARSKEAEAAKLPPGQQRDDILRDARQIKIAADMEKWLSSPGLRQPT